VSLRSWGAAYTREGRFSPVGVAFHWAMALLILFQLGLGWFLNLFPAGGSKVAAFALHAGVGIAILILALLRIVWRIMIPDPLNDADKPGWRTTFAYIVEHLFYLCFLVLPLTGWLMWSSLASPGSIDIGVDWPRLPFYDLETWRQWRIMAAAEDLHLAFVWLLMLMIPLHVGAALKHHFWDRNDVLAGMLPRIPDVEQAGAQKQRRRQPEPPPE